MPSFVVVEQHTGAGAGTPGRRAKLLHLPGHLFEPRRVANWLVGEVAKL